MKKVKKEFQRSSQRNEKGITLVALVITIVILIILAVVAINAVFGDSGLLRYAQDAGDYQANADTSDASLLNDATSYIDGIIGGNGSGGDNGDETDNPREVEGVTIPDGFYYVGGSKSEGIVISDDEADLGKGTSHEVAQTLVGNQFVWIPVEDDSLFKRYGRYYDGEYDETFLENSSEPYEGGYSTEAEEYEAMHASILENNGFYVGRYEAGTTATRNSSSGIEDEVVVKQGVNVYNYIGWSNSNDMANETGGAVELAKNFDTAKGYTSVTSTLIYGIEWDAVMNFIDPSYATGSCGEDSFVRDSSEKGWYDQDVPTVTGSNEAYAVKNIYDLGGNVFEWTMEAIEDRYRSIKGRQLYGFAVYQIQLLVVTGVLILIAMMDKAFV